MHTDIWSAAPSEHATPDLSHVAPLRLGERLFAFRECDLRELGALSADAADAVLVAGVLVQAYIEDATRLPEA